MRSYMAKMELFRRKTLTSRLENKLLKSNILDLIGFLSEYTNSRIIKFGIRYNAYFYRWIIKNIILSDYIEGGLLSF